MTAVEALELIEDHIEDCNYEDFHELMLLVHKIGEIATSYDEMTYEFHRAVFNAGQETKE